MKRMARDESQMDVVRKRSRFKCRSWALAKNEFRAHEFIDMSRTDLMARFVT